MLKTALAAVCLFGFAACPSFADSILTYYFSSDASYTDSRGTEYLAGSFDYDATTQSLVSVDFTVTGTGSGIFQSPTSVIYTGCDSYSELICVNDITGTLFQQVGFAQGLDLGGTDPLALTGDGYPTYQAAEVDGSPYYPALTVTGSVSTSATPEPASMVLCGAGLLFAGLARRKGSWRF